MRAIDQVVVRCRRVVDPCDRLAQVQSARQPAVDLEREADRHRHVRRAGGAHDPDRLTHLDQGVCRDHVRPAAGQCLHLSRVMALCDNGIHRAIAAIAIAARTDCAHQHDLPDQVVCRGLCAQEGHRLGVDPGEVGGGIPELGAPVGIGPPGRALQQKAGIVARRDVGEGGVIGPQEGAPSLALQQREGGELRQVHAVVKDQIGLEPRAGHATRPWSDDRLGHRSVLPHGLASPRCAPSTGRQRPTLHTEGRTGCLMHPAWRSSRAGHEFRETLAPQGVLLQTTVNH